MTSASTTIDLERALAKRDEVTLQVFLMGDGVTVAVAGQKTPDGYDTLDRMLSVVARQGGTIRCCGTCMDARGLTPDTLTARRWAAAALNTSRAPSALRDAEERGDEVAAEDPTNDEVEAGQAARV